MNQDLSKQTRLAVRRFLRRTESSSAVEMAVCGSVLVLCLCGIIDISNIYFNWQMVNEAAREGARLAAISTAVSGPGTSQSAVQTAIRTKYNNNNLMLTMAPSTLSSSDSGNTFVTVKVRETVSIITPLISPFFSSSPVLSGQCVMQAQ